jgi:hypothetical protein
MLPDHKFVPLSNVLSLAVDVLEELIHSERTAAGGQASTRSSTKQAQDISKELREYIDTKVAALQAATEAAASEQAALHQQISDLRNMAAATSSSGPPGPGAAPTGQPSCHSLASLQQQVDALRHSRLTAVPTKVVLRNVPRKYDTTNFLPVLSQCKLQSTDKIQCGSLPSRKADAPGNNLVLEFPADMRTDILAAASQLQLLEGIVMVPYLTPYGTALRRQRQPIYKELLDKGLRPTWRGGANLRYTDSSGSSVLYDFEAGPAA